MEIKLNKKVTPVALDKLSAGDVFVFLDEVYIKGHRGTDRVYCTNLHTGAHRMLGRDQLVIAAQAKIRVEY